MAFFFFFLLGIISFFGQIIVIRELLNSFYGNEFFIGLTLASWILATGLGSGILGKLIVKFGQKKVLEVLCTFYLILGLIFPLEIFLIRLAKNWGGLVGEIPNLLFAAFFIFIINFPLGLILGSQFPIISKAFSSKNYFKTIGFGYSFETLGFVLAGMFFYLFLNWKNEFLTVFLVSGLSFLSGGIILLKERITTLGSVVLLLFCSLSFSLLPFSEKINFFSQQFRFKTQQLIETKNTFYGNLTVTKLKNQYNFFESGSLLGSNQETIFNEYFFHLPLLYHHQPQKILLIGNGFNGGLKEILKHNPQKIYYAELDIQALKIIEKYLPEDLKKLFQNQKIKIVEKDPIYFLNNTGQKFDVIIINLPPPSTALLNRFYTKEFFQSALSHLKDNGILATHLPYSPGYLNKELKNLNLSFYKTLKEVFPFVLPLPDEENIFLASFQNILNYSPQLLIERFKKRKIVTRFLNEGYISYRLTTDRVNFFQAISQNLNKVKSNHYLFPVLYYYNTLYWLSVFYPQLAKFLYSFSQIPFSTLLLFLVVCLILFSFFFLKKERKGKSLLLAMVIASFSLMALEIILLLAFQMFFGNLYYQIVILITTLMGGLALGSWWSTKKIEKEKKELFSWIKFFHLALIVICLFLVTNLNSFSKNQGMFYFLMFLIGGLVGFEFSLLNMNYLKIKNSEEKKLGSIYSADLIGASLGAGIPSLFLIPVFGILPTILLLVVINLLVFILFLQTPER